MDFVRKRGGISFGIYIYIYFDMWHIVDETSYNKKRDEEIFISTAVAQV